MSRNVSSVSKSHGVNQVVLGGIISEMTLGPSVESPKTTSNARELLTRIDVGHTRRCADNKETVGISEVVFSKPKVRVPAAIVKPDDGEATQSCVSDASVVDFNVSEATIDHYFIDHELVQTEL